MNSEQDLILEAGGNIFINGGILSKEDSGRLFLKFGLNSTNENNPNDYFINSPVNLPGGQNLLIKQGKDGNLTTYTVLTELGVQNYLLESIFREEGLLCTWCRSRCIFNNLLEWWFWF